MNGLTGSSLAIDLPPVQVDVAEPTLERIAAEVSPAALEAYVGVYELFHIRKSAVWTRNAPNVIYRRIFLRSAAQAPRPHFDDSAGITRAVPGGGVGGREEPHGFDVFSP